VPLGVEEEEAVVEEAAVVERETLSWVCEG
jgi:hypothetical protein